METQQKMWRILLRHVLGLTQWISWSVYVYVVVRKVKPVMNILHFQSRGKSYHMFFKYQAPLLHIWSDSFEYWLFNNFPD